MRRIRILIVDDHELFRAGLRALLAKSSSLEVVGEAANGREALESIEKLEPDVVLMDVLMPQLNGLDATARIAAKHLKVRVLALSMNAAEEYVVQALRAGAAGYLVKNVSPAELETAIETVMRGETYLSNAISKDVLDQYVERTGTPGHQERLTPRQREVLQLVAEGRRSKEIARILDISIKTVELHRTQLMKSLDIHDVPGLVRYAIRIGLIRADY